MAETHTPFVPHDGEIWEHAKSKTIGRVVNCIRKNPDDPPWEWKYILRRIDQIKTDPFPKSELCEADEEKSAEFRKHELGQWKPRSDGVK